MDNYSLVEADPLQRVSYILTKADAGAYPQCEVIAIRDSDAIDGGIELLVNLRVRFEAGCVIHKRLFFV